MHMIARSLSLIALLSLSAVLMACPPNRPGGEGDDDNEDNGFGGLDTNGDGDLTPDDVAGGSTALFLVRVDGDQESEDGQTVEAQIVLGDGVYGLSLTLPGSTAWNIVIWFEDPDFDDFELSTGATEIAWVSVSDPSQELLAWATDTSGTINITEAGMTNASGFFEGSINIAIADQFEQPTGEELQISAFAFNDVPVSMPQ